jgi:hypothetical protein
MLSSGMRLKKRHKKREPLLGSLLSVSIVFKNPSNIKVFPLKTRSYSDSLIWALLGDFRRFLAKV